MASLTIERAVKRFGDKTVIDSVSFHAADREFVALLGPSGCGKSTLLRLVAGFERLDGGEIRIGGETVSGGDVHVPTERRRLGMVFQSYALWPHMNVTENVAFALKVQGVPPEERRARVARALKTVDLSDYAERRPAELSGGQRQRVALARTLATEPRVVLLDEPLANLDANLREAMQEEFRRFHSESAATMVFVTHDQAEALALADRVAVMMEGVLRQVDRPKALYDQPADPEVARFIGRGSILPVDCVGVSNGRATVDVAGTRIGLRADPQAVEGRTSICVRPEHCRVVAAGERGEPGEGFPARAKVVRFTGPTQVVTAILEDGSETEVLALADSDQHLEEGAALRIAVHDGWVFAAR
ncbi:MAG: ABC transporter ATP-binding protein [Pseudomonadota bacterium]